MSPATKKRLGIGMVGGGFVSGFHIRSFEAVRNADVRGVVSRTPETAARAAALANDLDGGSVWRYFGRHGISFKKNRARQRAKSARRGGRAPQMAAPTAGA